MSAFKAMDNANNPEAAKAAPAYLQAGSRQPAARGGVTRNPSQIKQMLLEWCQAATKNYKDKGVCVTNFSSSWSDGLAFCALIHNFHPDSFNFDELKASERRKNFQLAFDTAEKVADIAPLLDVEDMMKMKNPDWKCVFTYVQSFYRKFRSTEREKEREKESEKELEKETEKEKERKKETKKENEKETETEKEKETEKEERERLRPRG
uniref:Calponin-homology (CH) domain-containing protein n=1 Tax=Macrostomum lignano TaxID=282301 RepID=A0A1I8F1V0_9PLAT